MKGELKVYEFERFKSLYCGLCHTLGQEYGAVSRMILNYDFTFLAMLLWQDSDGLEYVHRRCVASPVRKKCCCAVTPALEACAGYSVILAWWKLRDSVRDERFIKSLPDRILSIFLKHAYKKASRRYPEFDVQVRKNLTELSALEQSGSTSLDGAADKFAGILSLAAGDREAAQYRIIEQLLYHVGRWIYIVDACDDLKTDAKAGRYNAVAARFEISGDFPPDKLEQIELTLKHSQNIAGAALELMPRNTWTDIIKNIVYLGMSDVRERVLSGKWTKPLRRAPK